MERRVGCVGQETSQKEEKAFGGCVVSRPGDIGTVKKDGMDPLESTGKVVSTPVRIEKSECIKANDGVDPRAAMIEIGLDFVLTG